MKHTLDDISFTMAADRGRTAAVNNEPYDANPYDRVTQPTLHRYWSHGHNSQRVTMAIHREQGILK